MVRVLAKINFYTPGATSASICPSGSYSNATGGRLTQIQIYKPFFNFNLHNNLGVAMAQAHPLVSGHPALLERTGTLVRDLKEVMT